jgi:hypothetical protein
LSLERIKAYGSARNTPAITFRGSARGPRIYLDTTLFFWVGFLCLDAKTACLPHLNTTLSSASVEACNHTNQSLPQIYTTSSKFRLWDHGNTLARAFVGSTQLLRIYLAIHLHFLLPLCLLSCRRLNTKSACLPLFCATYCPPPSNGGNTQSKNPQCTELRTTSSFLDTTPWLPCVVLLYETKTASIACRH